MSLLSRKRSILAKIESSYASDPTPTGASNAILLRNLNVNPLNATLVNRELIRPYLGNSDTLVAEKHISLDFEVEYAGAGTPGIAPGYGPLLRACGFSETLNTAAITITRSSSTATGTLTAHGLANGDTIRIAGASQTEYNGDFVIFNVSSSTFDFTVSGTPATPATGAPVLSRTAVYAPISSSVESVTIYFNNDGLLHKATGCRGSVEFMISVKQVPVFKFKMIGIYNAPSDTSAPTNVYTGFLQPKVPNTSNTTPFSLFSYTGLLESLSLDMAIDVQYRTLVGLESVMIVDRKPAGTIVIEAPTIAQKDYFTAAVNGTTGALTITHGTANGNKLTLAGPRLSIGNPTYQDSQGVQMLQIPFVASPSSGNDEVTLTVL